MLRFLTIAIGLLIQVGDASAQQPRYQDRVGDTYEIRLRSVTESATDDGSSSSSTQTGGRLIERVVAVRDDGLELEFDLPPDANAEDRAQQWQWPARVFKSHDGSLELLNASDLEPRIDAWLIAGDIPREACGRWIFTWNAFKIECDPHSVVGQLARFDLRPDELRDGGAYTERGGTGATALRMESTGPDGSTFVAETPIDPEAVRRVRAEADVVVAEITGQPTTFEAALQARAAEQIEGTIATTLTTDSEGRVIRRTTVTALVTTDPEGEIERSTATETVERRMIPRTGG